MDIITALGFGLLLLVVLSFVVFLHEAGHFLAARWSGVEVEAFAIGWGKVLWSRTWNGTEYRICLLPLGGYCKMKGEQDLIAALGKADGTIEASPGSLFAAPAWKRVFISAAGPIMNFLTALVVFITIAFTGTPTMAPESRVLLAADVDGRTGTAAEAAGLKSGDRVTDVGGKPVRTFPELQKAISDSQGREMIWTIDRDGLVLTKRVTPRLDPTAGRPLVGVYPFNPPVVRSVEPGSPGELAGLLPGDRIVRLNGRSIDADELFLVGLRNAEMASSTVEVVRNGSIRKLLWVPAPASSRAALGVTFEVPVFPPKGQPAWEAIQTGTTMTVGLLDQMLQGLGRLFTGKDSAVQSLTGPVGIIREGTQALTTAFGLDLGFGVTTLVNLVALLSLALFLMNLLPIPALDGGSIVVSFVEGLRRKRLSLKALMVYQQVGVVFVLGLLLFATLNDFGLFGKV